MRKAAPGAAFASMQLTKARRLGRSHRKTSRDLRGALFARRSRACNAVVIERLAKLATCEAPVAVKPSAPIAIGRARIPTGDPAIVQTVKCHGPMASARLLLDAARDLRGLELTVEAVPNGRGELHAVLSPMVATDVLDHIDKGLESPLLDFWPFGTVSAAAIYAPAAGDDPRTFTAVIDWR